MNTETNLSNFKEENKAPVLLNLNNLLLKLLSVIAGSGAGGAILLAFLFLGSAFFQQSLFDQNSEINIHPFFILLIIFTIFIALEIANLIGAWLWMLTDREHYPRIFSTIGQIFSYNLLLLIFFLPLYFLTNFFGLIMLGGAAFAHIVISTIGSFIILESMNNNQYVLVTLYGVSIGSIGALGICIWILNILPQLLVFSAVPITWFCLGFSLILVKYGYYWLYYFWGTDFLNIETQFGGDYSSEENDKDEDEENEKS